jgi:hypothetical protein
MQINPTEKLSKINLKCGTCTAGLLTVGVFQVGYHFKEGIEIFCPYCQKTVGRFEATIPQELFEKSDGIFYGKIG